MFFHKIEKIVKNYVERVENINIKVYTSGVDNMQIDHLREWFSYFIGNFDEIPYEIRKKPSGQDRTAAEGKFVAEATRRRRRILQSRILSYY